MKISVCFLPFPRETSNNQLVQCPKNAPEESMAKKRLTDITVQKLLPAPSGQRIQYQDELVPSLWLRITETGHKSWTMSYRYNGKQKRLTIGNFPAINVASARDAARKAEQQVGQGDDPTYLKKHNIQLQQEHTFRAVVENYFDNYAKQRNRTWKGVKRLIDAHATERWGDIPIQKILRRDVIALNIDMLKRKAKHPARHLFAALRRLFNWAAENNLIEVSPYANLKSPIQANERDRVLIDSEIRAIWNTCNKIGAPYGTLLQFLLVTGQRVGEGAKIRWKEIDFKEKTWRLPRERVKTDRAHEVPLSTLAVHLLQTLPRFENEQGKEGENYAFTTTGGRVPFSGFSKAKSYLDKESGISNWRVHDLRRTCATNLAKLEVTESIIKRILNHVESGVTAIYNRHRYLPEKREALEQWAERLVKLLQERD